MGDTLVRLIQEITETESEAHWFCPRTTAGDSGFYFDEDISSPFTAESDKDKAVRLQRIETANQRRDKALDASMILAYNGIDAKPYQEQFHDGLRVQLTRCDICIREYHRARIFLVQKLEAQFDIDEVRSFMSTFDAMNVDRIAAGLKTMTDSLLDLPPDQRTIKKVGDIAMYALLESLHCVPLLKSGAALQEHFDRPFKLVQTTKVLKMPSYTPAMGAFLFSHNKERSTWAMKHFSSVIKRPLTGVEFEHSVKPFLEDALARVNIMALEKDFLSPFWRAMRLIVSKLTKDLITNNLRAMDSNLYTAGLEHFQIEATHFGDLLGTYRALLELSATDFWEAMDSISAQTVAENIFRSPELQKMLQVTQETEPLQLEEKMDWTIQLVKSVKPSLLVPPVKIMLDQLLHALQKSPYSRYAQSVCWQKGFACLLTSIQLIIEHVKSGPTISHMVNIIATGHISLVMQELTGIEKKSEMKIENTEQLCLDIIEHGLALDVTGLTQDRNTIWRTKTLDHEVGTTNLNLWKLSIRQIHPGHPWLAASILFGIRDLLTLESFPPRHIQATGRQGESWNHALKRVQICVCTELLERLDALDADQLDELFTMKNAPRALVSLLFNGDSTVHQAALNVLKNMSGEDERRETVMHVVSAYPHLTLPAINEALLKIARSKMFTPCSTALKLCTDLFGSLCDSQDGILRTKKLPVECLKYIEALWVQTWQLLGTVFEQTEQWSNLGHDKIMMQDFCRETMVFADFVFNQYSIIASTLQEGIHANGETIRRKLLEHPKSRFMPILKWLRLRDEYLGMKAVSLTSKILDRLREVHIEIEDEAAQYLKRVIDSAEHSGKVRTKLSMQQKAELRLALERHTGGKSSETSVVQSERPKKQSSLEAWATNGARESTPTTAGNGGHSTKPGTINVEAWNDAAHRRKERRDAEDAEMKAVVGSMPGSEAYKKRLQQQQKAAAAAQKQQESQNSFLIQRRKEKEEAERRRAAAAKANTAVGAGSGVAGLGDIGKDHVMKGKNLLISSDEESDDDEDDDALDADLFGVTKKKIEKPNVNPDGALGLRPEQKNAPTRIRKTQRSIKDQRARLAPDLTPLHRTILKWDFFHTGDYPPGANEHQFKEVANTFADPVTYQETFQPLLTLEAWQGMVKAREENSGKPYEVTVQNRTNVDQFIEISSFIGHPENREIQIQEGDIVLLSKAKDPVADSSAPHCLARVYRVKRQKAHCEVVYQVLPGSSLAPSLTQKMVVWGAKVQSIIPLEREYGALQALQYYDLCTQIVRARPSGRLDANEKQVATYQDIWNVNHAQAEAIYAALTNEGFSLIQGPPGSGKTKTIVAIVGGLLTQALSGSSVATKISLPKASGNLNNGTDAPPKKLLVCAPSNAAVDELVMRLKEGVKTRAAKHHLINIVRIGRSEAINQQVLDVTMDELVAKRIGPSANDQKTRDRNAELFKEHSKVSNDLKELQGKRDKDAVSGKELETLESELASLRKRKRELGVRIDNAKDAERNAGREAELTRKKAQQAVLDEAHIICATLSGSGHDMFQSLNIDLDTVIIDEAAQCVEMSSLIPLKYGCVKCIMVGDPKQLPPTVFSKEAAKFQYEQSLFVRMQNNHPEQVHLLDTQYRMHPEISIFPSQTFYDDLLKDGPGMKALRVRPWHQSTLLAPYRFFDVAGQHQAASKGHSLINLAEIEIAMALYQRLLTDFPNYDFASKIGIITPYKSQLNALKKRFPSQFGNEVLDNVEFNTTDAFQGRESEIIIFSCVRASPAGGIGFLQDIRRMNVGLTRAKCSLWVLGNSESLIRGQYWKKLVDDARARDCYAGGDLKGMLKRPSSAFPASQMTTSAMLDVSTHVPQMRSGLIAPGIRPTANEGDRVSQDMALRQAHAAQEVAVNQPECMDGVRYRFEDRVKKSATRSDAGSDRSTPLSTKDADDKAEDVDMADDMMGTKTNSTVSRAETPLSGEEGRTRHANSPVKAQAGVPPAGALHIRKRPAPSLFMPRKQAKPRPP